MEHIHLKNANHAIKQLIYIFLYICIYIYIQAREHAYTNTKPSALSLVVKDCDFMDTLTKEKQTI